MVQVRNSNLTSAMSEARCKCGSGCATTSPASLPSASFASNCGGAPREPQQPSFLAHVWHLSRPCHDNQELATYPRVVSMDFSCSSRKSSKVNSVQRQTGKNTERSCEITSSLERQVRTWMSQRSCVLDELAPIPFAFFHLHSTYMLLGTPLPQTIPPIVLFLTFFPRSTRNVGQSRISWQPPSPTQSLCQCAEGTPHPSASNRLNSQTAWSRALSPFLWFRCILSGFPWLLVFFLVGLVSGGCWVFDSLMKLKLSSFFPPLAEFVLGWGTQRCSWSCRWFGSNEDALPLWDSDEPSKKSGDHETPVSSINLGTALQLAEDHSAPQNCKVVTEQKGPKNLAIGVGTFDLGKNSGQRPVVILGIIFISLLETPRLTNKSWEQIQGLIQRRLHTQGFWKRDERLPPNRKAWPKGITLKSLGTTQGRLTFHVDVWFWDLIG